MSTPQSTGTDRFRSVVETTLDAFGIYSAVRDAAGQITDFRVEYVNEAACAANRMTADEQIGRGLCELLPAHRTSGLFEAYCRLVEHGEPLVREALVYADSYHGRWIERAFDIRAVRIDDGFAASWRDITAQKRREHELELLAATGRLLTSSLAIDDTLGQLASLLVPALADACFVLLADDDGALRRVAAAFADAQDATIDAALNARGAWRWEQIPPIDAVVRSGAPQLLPAMPEPAREAPGGGLIVAHASSFIGVPLRANGRLLGVLALMVLHSGHSYDRADLHLAQELASCAGLAVQSARLSAEKTRADREAQAQGALLETLLQSAPVGFAVQDADTRYMLVNERLAALNGRSVAEHIGHSVAEVVPAAAAQNADAVRHVIATGTPRVGLEIRGPVPGLGGAEGVCEASYYPVRTAGGAVTAVGLVVVDVTSYRYAIEAHAASLERERAAHAAAEEARTLLDSLIAAAPVGLAFFDHELRFQHVNARLAAMHGLAPEQYLGHTLREVVPELADAVEPLCERVRATAEAILDAEIVGRAAPGEERSWRVSLYPVRIHDGEVRGVGAIIVEVTEQLRIAAALRASEEREQARAAELATVLQAVPAAVWIAHDPHSRVITGNAAAHALLQVPEGANLSKTAPEPERPMHFRVLKDGVELAPEELPVQIAAARGVEVRDFEEEVVFENGASRTLLGSATPLWGSDGTTRGAVAAFLDITERKAAERERARLLAEARATAERLARLQAVSAALSETLTVEQVADVIFEQGFAALDAMAGSVAVLDAQGTGFTSLRDIGYPPALAERYATFALDAALPIAEAVRARKPLLFETAAEWLARYPQLAQTGGAMVALPLLAGDRPLGGFAMIFADERNFSEDDRAFMQALAQQCAQALERAQLFVAEQQSRAQAEAAVRARDIFFEIAAHELRTPITALLGQAQLLQRRARRDTSISERDLRTAAVIGSQATRLNALVNALLDSSRLERGQLSLDRGPVDLSALVVRIVEESQPMLEHHSLVWELPDEPLVVDGDALRLEQVLQNLVGNAVKYSPAGGVVSIRARRDDQHMYVEVADQGMGIPASALPHLFQRFYRATNVDARQISGMGIGLYVVREIVHMHGGTVHASSTEGQGSTFVVTLPIPPGAERVSE